MLNYLEEKRKEKVRQENMEIMKDLVIGTAIGAAIGISMGLLLAPKPGEETRQDILDLVNKTKKDLEEDLKKKAEATKKWKENVDENIKTSMEEIKYKTDRIIEEPMEEDEKKQAIATQAEEIAKKE